MYHEVPVEHTIEDLYDGSLDDTEITDFISANIEAAQKEYNSVVKKAPKIGTDKAKYLQEKQAYQEEVSKAKAKVDYWQAVENERQRITHTSPEELKNAEDELSGEAARKDYRGITAGDEENPTSVEDLVRDFLRGAKITPEDFRKETGLSISEQKKFVGMISKQGKTIARLGEELADYDAMNLGGRFFDGDSNAARGAIIDALLSSRTRGDFKEQDATAEEERYIEAVEQQREQWYYENYHMTYEEYLQYREIVLPELLRKYANFAPDILYPQFVASFEDAYVAEHSQTNNTENNEQQRNDTTAEEPTTTPGDTVLQTEETNNSRGDSQSEEQPTEVPTGVRSSNENGTLPQSTPTEVDKEPLSEEAAQSLITSMEKNAIEDPEIRLTPQTWLETFGINNSIDTPIGKVRMGENQYAKLQDKKRTSEFGMISLTLSDPDVIFVEPSKAKGEDVAERNFSYVFAKTFKRNGNKVKYYTSVTVSIDGLEISVSSHFVNPNKMLNKLMEFNREYTKETLFSNSSEMRLAEHQSDVPDLLPTQENNVSSADKDTQSSKTKQEKENKFSPTPRKDGESITDYAERVAEEYQAQRTRKAEEAKVDTNPTDAQKEAGNYKKGHIKVDGLNITIEQPKGSIRRGTDANGKQWESEMHNTYGYIRGTESVDGDHIDIFLSDNPTEGNVFVVDQVNKDGSFDEHKVMYGFPDMESAKQAYLSNYEEGWQGLGNITEVSKEDFKAWIDSSKRKTKPFTEYTSAKTQDDTQTKKPTEENAAPVNTETNENYAHNSEDIMHEQKNVQLQQAINAYENATKFYYQQLKEGKLDKVFESKQWKDVLRKQTELQKILLQLNSEELKELLKQTTNEDTKKEIKGALDAVLRQEQRSIEYNAVLDKQEPITPIYKEEKKPIAVTEFVETDKKEAEIHPVLTGVYHDNGYVVGTNAHILLARKEDYNKSLEGKITNKKGEVIDGKYPNWRAVVEGETTTNSWGINLDELHAFVRGVLTKLKADGAKKSTIDSANIAFKDTDGKIIVCNAKTLDKALRGAKSIGATEFGNTSETFAHAQTKKGYVVCPTISTYHSINDNCFVYAPKEAARQQTTATLTNDTEAKQKATEAVLAALSKAGIEVVQATDEQAQAMLANEIGAEKQVVYHGSRAKFKNFDHSHMGEGEGQQAYGWGSYVTEVESIGRTYAAGNGKIKFRDFVLEAMHSLEVKEHFSGAERKVLNFLHKWIKRSNNASTAIEKVKEWASNEYEKYSGRRNWSDQDYKDYFGAISKRDVCEWRKEMEEKEENAQQMLSFIETLSVDDFSLPQRHLYTVDIPDDTGSNYLNWEQPMSDEQLDAIEEYLKENYRASRVKIFTDGIAKSNSSNAQEVDAFTRQGKNIYHLLEHTIGDNKSVSEMLGSLGYTGISYPAQYQSGGRADNARNYVIFNEKDLKITDHIQFMRTPQGTIYGWSVNGKIYLTEAGINPDTPIHEYTHLWAEAMMIKNKKGWDTIKALLKDNPIWNEVVADANYSNIADNEDAVASEVLSRISGKKNAAKMEEEAQRAIDEAKGVFEKARATTILTNLKKALNSLWKWVSKNIFDVKEFSSINEVTDKVLYDLIHGTKLINDKSLIGVHNISEQKLRKVLKQGGFANPSIAVIDTDKQVHNDYGEISLILPSRKVNKSTGKNVGTYEGDAWTPMYPIIEKQMSNDGNLIMHNDINSVPNEMQSEVRNALNRWLDNGSDTDLSYLYLFQQGKAPKMATVKPKYSNEVYKSLRDIMFGVDSVYNLTKGEVKKLVELYVQTELNGDIDEYNKANERRITKYKETIESGRTNSMYYKIAERNLEEVKKYGYPLSSLKTFADDVQRDKTKQGSKNVQKTLNAASQIIKDAGLEEDFRNWVEGLNNRYQTKEVIFDGFTPTGKRRYIPNTLENVSKLMKKQGRQASTGLGVSFSNFAASVMKANGSLANIRKKKSKLTNEHKDIENFEEKWKEVYFDLAMKLQPNASTFDDYGFTRLQEAALEADPQAFLSKEYGVTLSKEDVRKLQQMVKAIQEERPAMYFETKFERPVTLNEFSKAVVPEDLSDDLQKTLRDNGIEIFTYKRGDAEDRQKATQEAAYSSDDIAFQIISNGNNEANNDSDTRFQIVGNSLSDEEKKIVETAKANDTYMKAPNGKPTNLSEKQWTQVRTTAFKNWFGDWEKAARIEKVRRSKAVVISGSEYKDKYELNRDSAKEWIKDNLRGEYTIADTEEIVSLTKVGANKVTSHGMSNKAHLQSIAAIPQLIRHAIFIEERPNEKHNNKYDSYKYYICGLKIGTTDYTVKLTIGVKSGKKYYDHALTEIEKGKLLDRINDQADKKGFTTTGDAPLQSYALSIGKDSKLLSILQTNSSKVVDENGEPMVVYHGTLADGLRQFSTDFIGSRYSYDEKGFFFISNRKIADDYAVSEFDASRRGEVIDAYVSLGNPLVVNSEWCRKNDLGSNVFKDNDVIEFWDNYQSLIVEESEQNDGVIVTDGETSMVVAFFPNQIKSATGNNGNFSTTEDDILYRTVFGGNSGYVGYSMSKRAAEAKEEGRYPKTEFRREYHITAKSLDTLTSLGFINNSEWHHTSMYGNKTPFYGWAEDELADDYLKHKKEIDTLCKGIDPKTKQPLLEKVEKPQYEHEYEMPQYGEAETAANSIREWRHKQIEKYDQFTGFKGYAEATEEEKKERDAYLHSLNEQMEEKIREMLAKDYPDYLAAKNALDAYNNYEEDLRKAIGEHIKEYLDIDKYSQRWREQTATTQPTTNTEELTNHAESVVQNLHLNNVEIVPDGSSLNGEQATAKGFYNKRTGKIVVVAGNHTDIADIEKTVLHEAVAHHGLRELFGDNFDNFLDTVFAKADIETRQQIAHLSAKHGWNVRTATEEYLASMAEDTNFEQIKPTLWQRIKQLFGEIMSAFGLHHANITDNDLRYILWRSYKNLQGGGKHSILDKAEDIAMQYRLKAGNYIDKFTDKLNAVNERFNEELSNLTEENADKVTLWLGKPSKVLLAAGVEDKPMKLYGNKVIRKMKKHGFSLEELRDLPRAVADPVAVFNNYQREGNRSILTELKTQQGNFLVSVNIGKDADINFNIVRSVFGKGNENVVAWINNGLATYINKEKALSFLSHQSAPIAATAANAGQESSNYLHFSERNISEASNKKELSSAAKIIKDFHNPKLNSNVLYRSSIDPTATEVLPDARTRYEEETKEPDNIDSVPKTHNFFRRFYKSYVDSILALKSFTNSVLEATGDKMASHEDTYKAENAMTSKNKTDGEVYNPLFSYMPLYLYM